MAASLPLHDAIKPLEWLLGSWYSTNGEGGFPTISTFKYGEKLQFHHVGQPNIQFSAYAWHLESKKPLHRELGFIRIKPGTNEVAWLGAQNLGLVEIEEGMVTGKTMHLESHTIGRLTFAREPITKKIVRKFSRVGDTLEQTVYMRTSNTEEMTKHLQISYQKL
ncbi:THAP4 [Acanthosepion pharaonis]|uniref:THAP4 n=1 Tax=Acanthosepion pharaonis TaxID=158019 RepID=A0A812EJD6_ACAPH|nr:THAP4 [Sepia pharaonis]